MWKPPPACVYPNSLRIVTSHLAASRWGEDDYFWPHNHGPKGTVKTERDRGREKEAVFEVGEDEEEVTEGEEVDEKVGG